MQVLNTYRMKTPTRTIDLAPGAEPQTFANGEAYTLTPLVRLISAEGKTLTNGTITQPCVITGSSEVWTEVDAPDDDQRQKEAE